MAKTNRQKVYYRNLRRGSKKGSSYMTKDGTVKQRTDFQRGVCMGRYQVHCEQAKYWKDRKASVN